MPEFIRINAMGIHNNEKKFRIEGRQCLSTGATDYKTLLQQYRRVHENRICAVIQ